MMDGLNISTGLEDRKAGESAVTGLINGLLAGAAMLGYLIVALGIQGESPADVLRRFAGAGVEVTPVAGALSHLAVSAIYGAGFALILHRFAPRLKGRVPVVVGALIYAGVLFAIAELVLLPAAKSPMLDIPLHFGIGHLIYAFVLGLLSKPSR